MAVSLLSHDVSDLCIGKPPLKSLPAAATVADAVDVLKSSADVAIKSSSGVLSKISMVDVLCFLCNTDNIGSPVSALRKPVSVLLSKPASGGVRRVGYNSSIWEALDVILEEGAESLVVPITRRSASLSCWLTQEDLLRYFLNSIFLFSSIASKSVASLNLIKTTFLSVRHHSPALSALSLVRSALLDGTAVAVLTDDDKLIGEISPSTLSSCDQTLAAAIACLSAGELMSYIDYGSGAMMSEVKSLLQEKKMHGMVELLEDDDTNTNSNSSSSDEETEGGLKRRKPRRTRSGSYSARMGRRLEEAIVCHPESSLVAVMVQALAHRVSYVWVVDQDYALVGVVTFRDVLTVFREQVSRA